MDIYKFKGLIFDLDGTLIDSANVWHDIDVHFLKKRGIDIPEDYAKMVSTMNFKDAAEYTKQRFSLDDTADQLIEEWFSMALYEYAHNIKAKPHAREFLLRMKEAGIKLALATASSRQLYEAVLKNNCIYEYFDYFASTDQVERGKGFPDVYELAARGLGLYSGECAVFEDIIEGIEGAKAGGFTAIAVINGCFIEDEEKMKSLADLYISDYKELLV